MTLPRITVVVVDDHPVYREAISRAVKARHDLDLVGEAADGRTAIEQITQLKPDVCVLDVELPDLNGGAVLNALMRDHLPTRAIFLSGHLDSSVVYKAIEAGAVGFLGKTTIAVEICDAIVAVARGETVLPKEVSGGLGEQIRLRKSDERPLLTERQDEVLRLIAEGESVAEIAGHLHLAPGTVKSHLGHLYDKLDVSNRAAAVAYAIRHGLIE